MRVWDCILPENMCRQHLLGEHREIHAIWNIVILGRRNGYENHPETKRWIGHEVALYEEHFKIYSEMIQRGYRHRSPLLVPTYWIVAPADRPEPWEPVDIQMERLKAKGCDCIV